MENIPAYDEISANLRKRAWLYLIIATAVFILGFNYSENLTEWLGDKLLPNDATVVYPASYFAQYQVLSVSGILDRIPGINVARQGSGNRGGPGSSPVSYTHLTLPTILLV